MKNKKPKVPRKFLHPRLYWRDRKDDDSNGMARVRIIYPDKTISQYTDAIDDEEWYEPCWDNRDWDAEKCKISGRWQSKHSARERVRRMKDYDQKCGYKTIFLGEIK